MYYTAGSHTRPTTNNKNETDTDNTFIRKRRNEKSKYTWWNRRLPNQWYTCQVQSQLQNISGYVCYVYVECVGFVSLLLFAIHFTGCCRLFVQCCHRHVTYIRVGAPRYEPNVTGKPELNVGIARICGWYLKLLRWHRILNVITIIPRKMPANAAAAHVHSQNMLFLHVECRWMLHVYAWLYSSHNSFDFCLRFQHTQAIS